VKAVDAGGMGSHAWVRRPRLFPAIAGVALFFVIFGARENPFLALASLAAFAVLLTLFWRPGEPLVFLYVFIFQWLECSVGIFYASLFDAPLDEYRRLATLLLLAGLVLQALGVRWAMGPIRPYYRDLAETQILRVPQRTWFRLYLATLAIAAIARLLATMMPPLSQPLLVLPLLKWAAYVIFTFASFYRRDANRTLWAGVFVFEILFSLGDYFSSFKFVFLFTFLGIALVQIRLSAPMKAVLAVVAAVAILFAAIWSAIKGEYRYFVAGDQYAQVVTVDYTERAAKFAELISALDWHDLVDGVDLLLQRLEYAEYFADVASQIPRSIAHTGGELWMDALTRPLMPRLFFPDKAIIDESDLTARFTGREIAGFEEGTQISIGYMAEAYIDYGIWGMMPLLFVLGVVQGGAYRWLMQNRRTRGVMGIGLACAVFVMSFGSIGISSAKLVGSFVVSLLVIWFFLRFVAPTRLRRLIEVADEGA
jgi:hypothetical protein